MKFPDAYVLVRVKIFENNDGIKTGEVLKLFSTFYGGYLDGDSWRLNSGITKVVKIRDDTFQVFGKSTTVYEVGNVGVSSYTASILQSMVEKVPDYCEATVISNEKEVLAVMNAEAQKSLT